MRRLGTRVAFSLALAAAPALVAASCGGNGPVTLATLPEAGAVVDGSSGDAAGRHDAPAAADAPSDATSSGDDAADAPSAADAQADSLAGDAPAADGGSSTDSASSDAPPSDAAAFDAASNDAAVCAPVTQPCDVVCQNCGANLKCDPISASFNDGGEGAYCTNAGTVAPDQQCDTANVDDCAAGGVCLQDRSSPALFTCFEMCRKDVDCKNGGLCAYGPFTGTSVKICTPKVTGCDPVADTGCGSGTGCYLLTSSEPTGCHLTGTLGQDQTCTSEYDCMGGYSCVGFANADGGTSFKCAKYCHTAANDCPGADAGTHFCYSLNGFTGPYGVCGP